MPINFSHIERFELTSYSAFYLTNGDYITYLLEKLQSENKEVPTMKKWIFFVLFEILEAALYYTKCFHVCSLNFPCFVKTSRERNKSAPYLRLKNSKKTS